MNKDRPPGKGNGRRAIGLFGESEAAAYLQHQGCAILNRNWRCRIGELDIVAKSDSTIVFVEVRTRRVGGRFGSAVESVDYRKQLQVRSTAEVFLSMNKLHESPVRFDVIAITIDQIEGEPLRYEVIELKHVVSAF